MLFRRGDTFRGALVITRSGSAGNLLTFGAYGGASTDPNPVLNASAPLSGWKSVGANIWEVPCPSCGPTVTGVYAVGGRALPLGRYPNLSAPNRGYLSISSHQNATQLTSAALAGNWVGGEAVVRSERWILDRAPITAQSGTTLTLTNASGYGLKDGWGFFIQNHPATLDQPGEWYFDANAKKIRLFATAAPADGAIEATTAAPAGVRLDAQQYVVLENLTLMRSYQFGLDAENASHCIVRGVRVLDAGQNGVRVNGSGSDVLFENNLLQNVNNNGVNVSGYADFTFRNNVLRAIGLVPGRGLGGDGNYFAFNLYATNRALVQGNTLDSLGYVGLAYYTSSNVTIERNAITNFCLTKDDGGGIYTWNGGGNDNNLNARILNNIVVKAVGAAAGTDDPRYVPGNGIYLDDCSLNVEVSGNTVAGCASNGIFLHGNRDIVVRDNTCFDNGIQLLVAPAGPCANTRLTIKRNVLVSADPGKRVADYDVPPAAVAQLSTSGTFGSNYYARPFDEVNKLRAGYREYQLADWQAASGFDAGSRNSPVRFRPYRVDSRLGNTLLRNGLFAANTASWSYYTSAGNGQLAWDDTNRLGSGGSLRLSFNGASGQPDQIMTAEAGAGAVRLGQRFAVRFRAACATGSKVVSVYLKRTTGDYADLTPRTRVLLTPAATDYEIAFITSAADPTASLAFTVGEDANQEWLDNVDLREATLTPASEADSIRFEYNATNVPRPVSLPAGARFVDVRNAPYSGSLTLAPFASVVLLRAGAAAVNPLPVELVEFTATAATNGDADLAWATASERDNSYFAVERSADGQAFAEIGRVPGRGGSGPARYAWRDAGAAQRSRAASPTSPLYYRLRQVDVDGRASYSAVRAVAFGAAPAALLWPNPSAGPATLDLRGFAAGPCQVELLDATGQAVRRLTLPAGRTHALELGGLPAGVFLLRVAGPAGQASQRVLRE